MVFESRTGTLYYIPMPGEDMTQVEVIGAGRTGPGSAGR